MNHFRNIFIISIIIALPVLAQAQVKDAKNVIENQDVEKQKILEFETTLKKQQQELEELKKNYGVKAEDKTVTPPKETSEETYISPLKKNGMTPEYNRSMFLDPENGKKFNKDQKPWLNDWIRVGAYIRPSFLQ